MAWSSFQVKIYKTPQDHFWKIRCRKNALPLWREIHFQIKIYKTYHSRKNIRRSIFPSQNIQNTSVSDDFWKLRCRKSTRRYSTKQHLEVNIYKIPHWFASLLEVEMPKKSIPLRYEVHFKVKILHHQGSDHFWVFDLVVSFHYATLHSTTLHYTTLHNTTTIITQLHSTTLNYATQHYITLRYTALSSTTLHYITLHYTPLHYNYNYNYTTTLHYTPLH